MPRTSAYTHAHTNKSVPIRENEVGPDVKEEETDPDMTTRERELAVVRILDGVVRLEVDEVRRPQWTRPWGVLERQLLRDKTEKFIRVLSVSDD